MILDDIADDTILVKISTTALSSEVFAEYDLDIADVLPAPQRFKHEVRKPKHLQMTQLSTTHHRDMSVI